PAPAGVRACVRSLTHVQVRRARGLGPALARARLTACLRAEMLGRVRQQGDVAGSLERHGELALVTGAGAGLPPRLDLGSLRQVAPEAVDLLIVDLDGLVGAERTDLPATPVAVEVVALARSSGWHSVGSPG